MWKIILLVALQSLGIRAGNIYRDGEYCVVHLKQRRLQ
jgi:uncharacterized membrane protein